MDRNYYYILEYSKEGTGKTISCAKYVEHTVVLIMRVVEEM